MASILEGADHADLVLGRDPRDHADAVDAGRQSGVVERVELGSGDGLAPDAEVAGDARRGRGVVAGDHLDVDAGTPAQRDRLACLRPGGVEQTDHPEQTHRAERRLHGGRCRIGTKALGDVSVGEGKHP